ncbi:extracellular solute-binding protein [Kiloniella laminariae]|uniref:Extracellular solute-binding protein n=1 Tax=Kiloniella laminariae TaxID=454162 RepID=A0ABT4LDP9_9PROT|nr:extracellular solute-binding protein [Kiloniella laminariae]MCZ4279221.1 extracellular solute-binding protein [Kiloniella laminariae]
MNETLKTLTTARMFTRRGLLKNAAMLLGGASIPLLGRKSAAGAASEEISVWGWQGQISDQMITAFKEDTGIQIRLVTYRSNAEALDRLVAAKGETVDLVFPTTTALKGWHAAGLLQMLDESKLQLERIRPGFLEKSMDLGARYRGRRYAMPFNWGVEGVAYDSHRREYLPGKLSWSDLWSDINRGLMTVRPMSALMVMALMLDGTGERLDNAYQNPENANEVFADALGFARAYKSHVHQFWRDSQELRAAFLEQGCVIGQAWEGTAAALSEESNNRFRFLLPKEGGLAWQGAMAVPAQAKNVDQAYQLMNWLISPKAAALYSAHSGFHSAALGAEGEMDGAGSKRFRDLYQQENALENLYWWKAEPEWFAALKQKALKEYLNS